MLKIITFWKPLLTGYMENMYIVACVKTPVTVDNSALQRTHGNKIISVTNNHAKVQCGNRMPIIIFYICQ